MAAEDFALALLVLAAAVLYSSVGHGGASGYLAVMALAGVAPAVMKPTALALNIIVAAIALFRYCRAGAFCWPLLWPLALASVPFAYLGGMLTLPAHFYKPLVGLVLIYAAWYTFRSAHLPAKAAALPSRASLLLPVGAALGLLSGLTGVGGGIFLSPLLLFLGWAEPKIVSGTAAAFILVNSLAGLLGLLSTGPVLHPALPWWAAAAAAGGLIGAELGSRRMIDPTIRKVLALVLLIGGVKMVAALA